MAFVKMFGYPSHGKMLKEVKKPGTLYINPDVRKHYLEKMKKEGIVHDFENECLRADGKSIWITESCTTIFKENGEINYYEGVVIDITKRKKIEENLRTSTEKQLQLIEIMNEGFVQTEGIDDEEIFTVVNESMCSILGYERNEIIMQPLYDFLDEENQKVVALQNEKRKNGIIDSYELSWTQKDGSKIITIVSPQVLKDQQGKIIHNSAVITDITELKKIQEELRKEKEKAEKSAFYDLLTGLPNRKLFFDRLDTALANAEADKEKLAVLLVDIDDFDQVNSKYGEDQGDKLLIAIAGKLKKMLRGVDTISRWGSDEFAIILPDIKAVDFAVNVAGDIVEIFDEPFDDVEDIKISASMGISIFPDDADNSSDLIKRTITALKQARDDSNKIFQFFDPIKNEKALAEIKLEKDLDKAIKNNEFYLAYQPQMDIDAKKVSGVEALVRWKSPTRGIVAPSDFIRFSQRTGQIKKIGDLVLEDACSQLYKWQKNNHPKFKISVNVAAEQFVASFPEKVEDILKLTGLDPKWLDIELTESTTLARPYETLGIMNNLRKLGITISLDDFGTGYSSMAYLKDFPVDTIKIDKSFIDNIADVNVEFEKYIVAMIINIASHLGLKVIAEGVESKEQAATLHTLGCKFVQGYYYSKPLSKENFEKYIEEKRKKD